jgi:hypothetical protein
MPTTSSQRGRAFRARRRHETIRDLCWYLAELDQHATVNALRGAGHPSSDGCSARLSANVFASTRTTRPLTPLTMT